jgi:hypothetical protein
MIRILDPAAASMHSARAYLRTTRTTGIDLASRLLYYLERARIQAAGGPRRRLRAAEHLPPAAGRARGGRVV